MGKNLLTALQRLVLRFPLAEMNALERQVTQMPDAHRWTERSPVRFEIMEERLKRGSGPELSMMHIMIPAMLGIRRSLKSLARNPRRPKTEASPEFIAALADTLHRQGASSVGYARVPERWIFRNKAILHTNAITMTMEMDKASIETAPSVDAMRAVMEIYRDLGRIANGGAGYLREHGYSAHAGHPLMGLALYPPLAQLAGLGWMGANGLVVTPEHGPRVRLAAIFTSIENLPFASQNEHRWVEEYCADCQVCVRQCPAAAIKGKPQLLADGRLSHIINERCFPYFCDHYGCSVCIAVCPFSRSSYASVRERYVRSTR